MNRTKILSSIILVALMVITPIMLLAPTAHAQAAGPGPATDRIEWTRVTLEEVGTALETGAIDVYVYGIRARTAQELAGKPGIKLYTAPAGLVDFGLNPAPVYTTTLEGLLDKRLAALQLGVPEAAITYLSHTEDGNTYVELGAHPDYGINPLAFRQIRFALNYLVDRKFIADHIYNGYAIPMYTFLAPADPTYTIIADIVAKYKFEYNPALAEQMITSVLEAVGAYKIGDKWYYADQPIKLTFIIRIEDERHEIGLLLANELERIGFTIEKQEVTFAIAIRKVYLTNPADFEWHIYTEGWGKGALDRWDMGTINQFGAPWFGWLPGWADPEYWNYKNETIDELGQKIYFGKFNSFDEYVELYRQATELIIQESVRVWVATIQNIYPARAEVKGVTVDLGAGFRSLYFTREVYIPGSDTVKVGHRWAWTATSVWNPFGGFDDVYSVDPMRATYDYMMWFHPFNGEPIPFRADFEVETAGPTGTLEVPADAVTWDAVNDQWVAVGSGVTATSKVTFDMSKYIGTKWHHGVEITWADVLASWVTSYEIAYDPEKSQLESSIAGPLAPYMDTIKAIRILPDQNKIEIYVDYWHFDPNYIASYAFFGMSNPAELQYVQFYLAFETKTYALSETRAESEQIPWLSLIIPEHVADIKAAAQAVMTQFPANWFTIGTQSFMTETEWVERLNALISWIDTYGLAWISNGPFKLVYMNTDEQKLILEAFRDPTYPFSPGDWYFGEPVLTKIISVEAVTTVAPGDPIPINVTVSGLPPLHVKFILKDPATGNILVTGEAEEIGDGLFRAVIPGEITAGLTEFSVTYELIVLAYSEQVAMPDEYSTLVTITFATTLARLQEQLNQMQQQTQEQLANLQQQFQEQLNQMQQQTQEQLASLQEQLQSQLQEVQAALGESVAQSFQQVSQSIAQLGETFTSAQQQLSSTIAQQFQQLSETFTNSLQQVSNAIASVDNKVGTVSDTLDTVKQDVATANSGIQSLGQSLDNFATKVSDALNTLKMLVAVILVLQLALLGLTFYFKRAA